MKDYKLYIQSLETISNALEDCWEMKFEDRKAKWDRTLAEIVFDDREIIFYEKRIKENKEYNLTILHEFQHLKDYYFDKTFDSYRECEIDVEKRAIYLYNEFPELLVVTYDHFPELYNIKFGGKK